MANKPQVLRPKCAAFGCGRDADCAVAAQGEHGAFEGNLCAEHGDQIIAILNPTFTRRRLLHAVNIRDMTFGDYFAVAAS